MHAEPIFHLLDPAQWPSSGWYAPASLGGEGFVHFSFRDQVTSSADRHFGIATELVAIEFDPADFDVPLRVEDSYGSGTSFPHLYGPVPVAAARVVHQMCRDRHGHWQFRAQLDPVDQSQ